MRFIIGLLLGIALGASVGLLLASQRGTETRKDLGERWRRSSGQGEEEL